MVSIHRVPIAVILIISIVCFIFRFKRGDEIDAWLNECNVKCQYVIIDDLDGGNFNEHQLSRLLVVNPFNGLDEEIMKRAIAILNQEG